MPRAIADASVAPGIASYRLGGNEAWTLLAATFALEAAGLTNDDSCFLECHSPAGGIIYRQNLGEVHFYPVFFSLSPGAEPWDQFNGNQPFFPQNHHLSNNDILTERLSPVALVSNCTLYVYAHNGSADATSDPMASLDTGVSVQDLHLWVEDAEGSGGELTPAQDLPIFLQQSDAALIRPEPIPGRGD